MAKKEYPQSVKDAVKRLIAQMDKTEITEIYSCDRSSFRITSISLWVCMLEITSASITEKLQN